MKTDQGREILLRLAEQADVVVENMRPGVTRRLGVDFDAVRKRNPRIVYGSISGFGQYGPYTSRPSIDQIAQGMSGIMSVTGIPGQVRSASASPSPTSWRAPSSRRAS